MKYTVLTILILLALTTKSLAQKPDTNYYKVFPYNEKTSVDYRAMGGLTPVILSEKEIKKINTLYVKCVAQYNRESKYPISSKRRHFLQIIGGKDKNGEVIAWVNCICINRARTNLKTEIIRVGDGGNCYFNFIANLTNMSFYNLEVNDNG